MIKQERKFVFIDLEMTGLDQKKDVILEAALIITDHNCNPLHQGISFVIFQQENMLSSMDQWCTKTHAESGLIKSVRESTYTVQDVQNKFVSLIKQYAGQKSGILAGNSVWQDRLFLERFMPEIVPLLHYRILDVSSIKEIFNAWKKPEQKEFKKQETHRALSDIQETIEELKFYKANMF